MKSVRAKAVDLQSLSLSPEEGFVLSRLDGTTTVKELVALTGLDEQRLVGVVGRLHEEGAVEVDPEPPTGAEGAGSAVEAALLAFLRDEPTSPPPAAAGGDPRRADEPALDAQADPPTDEPALDAQGDPPTDEPALDAQGEPPEPERPRAEGDEEASADGLANRDHRKVYESMYRSKPKDARALAATTAAGGHLLALCLDPDAQVIQAVLSNPRSGLEHGRLIALSHRTAVGLEAVARRSELLADASVQRRMLRNPQLPTTILDRIVRPRPLIEVYKVAVDREIPERTRVLTREVLRKKFMLASSDERASLLVKTEGRCLVLLVACSLDAHATQILCGKQTFTVLFIQNLARWSATPPALLTHLLKNPVVRRNPGLRKMVLKHPNTPSDAKRGAT